MMEARLRKYIKEIKFYEISQNLATTHAGQQQHSEDTKCREHLT